MLLRYPWRRSECDGVNDRPALHLSRCGAVALGRRADHRKGARWQPDQGGFREYRTGHWDLAIRIAAAVYHAARPVSAARCRRR
jgi:hypothetical protein